MDEDGVGLVETAFRCLAVAIDMVQPGAMYRDIGNRITKIARERGEHVESFFFSIVNVGCTNGVRKLERAKYKNERVTSWSLKAVVGWYGPNVTPVPSSSHGDCQRWMGDDVYVYIYIIG